MTEQERRLARQIVDLSREVQVRRQVVAIAAHELHEAQDGLDEAELALVESQDALWLSRSKVRRVEGTV